MLVILLGAGSCSFEPTASASLKDGGALGLIDADRPDASLSTGACLEAPYELRAGSTQRYYLETEPMNYDSAQTSCREAGATLVVVNDLDEHLFVHSLGGGDPWMGFNDIEYEGKENYAWVTGDVFDFTHWSGSEPDNSNDQDCAILQEGGWGDRDCGQLRQSVCECEPERLVAPAPDCRTNEVYDRSYASRLYRLETAGSTYQDAMASCAADGAHLVVLSDERENEFVHNLSPAVSKWIGKNDLSTEGNFEWVTGSVSEFKRWAGQQPDDNLDEEDCVEMYPDRNWNDASCDLYKEFVCECAPNYRAPPPAR